MTSVTHTGRFRRLAASVAFCLLTAALLTYAGDVLKPPRTGASDGAVWAAFTVLEPDSIDVLFLGNSHAFTGVDTATLWEKAGIPSFVNAGPTQKLEVTKYYLRESLRTQHPRVVAIEMSSLSYARDRFNQSFHDININYMPWSAEKIAAGLVTSPPKERVGALLDLWTYHGRWRDITRPDFDVIGKDRGGEYLHGFMPRTKSQAVTETPHAIAPEAIGATNAAVDYNLESLREIAALCDERGIELLLFLTPTGPPNDYSYQLDRAGSTLMAEFDNVHTLDLSQPGVVPGLSYTDDFYDGGHLIYTGARKSTAVLATYLAETYGLEDRRGNSAYADRSHDVELQDAFIQRHKDAPGAK
jgi:hypothetical protein